MYEIRNITKHANALNAAVVINQSYFTDTLRVGSGKLETIELKLYTNLLAFNEFTSLLNSLQLEC